MSSHQAAQTDAVEDSDVAPHTAQEASQPALPHIDRRAGGDRRHRPTSFLDSLWGRKQRHRGRRSGDIENSYVDVYRRRDLLLVASVFILNVFDAGFTLVWLQQGGREANPLMDELIQMGDWVFLLQKCFFVGIWLVVLAIHKNFRIARIGLWMLLGLYGVLLLYHFYLHAMSYFFDPIPA